MNEQPKYKMTYDLHTHTTFSHGIGSIEDNVRAAVEKGLSRIAISDHGPGHLFYGVKRSAIPEMRAEVKRLKPLYPDIEICLSVEANFVESENGLDVTREEYKDFDFVIAGYHYGVARGRCIWNWCNEKLPTGLFGKSLMIRNTDNAVRAIYENDIKILTHPGEKGPFDIDELAKACEATGTLMEISTHHDHMTTEEIKICSKYGVGFIISSDAHRPERVGTFEGGVKRAQDAGLDISRIVNITEI